MEWLVSVTAVMRIAECIVLAGSRCSLRPLRRGRWGIHVIVIVIVGPARAAVFQHGEQRAICAVETMTLSYFPVASEKDDGDQ